jgi:NAD(P)-dependent dehydrogenase (short-subunit alcohol dehydrogenase family)
MSQESKIALVTGAGSGIGRGCAHALLGAGWSVVFAGRRPQALDSAIQACAPETDRAVAIPCDVSREESVAALFAEIRDRFGRLDLLFNNAGTSSPPALPDELSASAWRHIVDTNLNGAFYCLAEAFKLMRQQVPRGGRIINNGSISAHVPRPGSIAYAATKHAVTGLTRAAALDGRAFDIAVGQIDIGNAMTEMSARMAGGMPQADGTSKPEARMELSAVTETFMATQMPYLGRG